MNARRSYYYAYRIEHLASGRFYVGIRTSRCLPEKDRYFGSGLLVRRIVAKHGTAAFTRTILQEFASQEDALRYEAEVVTLEFLADPLCMNLVTGGHGGRVPGVGTRERQSSAQRARFQRDSEREKRRTQASAYWSTNAAREKQSAAKRGRKHTPESRANMAAAQRARWARPGAREGWTRSREFVDRLIERTHRGNREAWADPVRRAKRIASLRAAAARRKAALLKSKGDLPGAITAAGGVPQLIGA